MSKHILLTGAEGFTGRHFARIAKENGYVVGALESDLTDIEALHLELADKSFDYLVHLAAISAVTHASQQDFYNVNLFGTLNLLAAVSSAKGKPEKILIASSANVYGNSTTSPIDESVCPVPVNHYAMSKLAMECMTRAQFDNLPLIYVRPFNYTGPGQDARFVIPKIVSHFLRRSAAIELGNMDVEREFNDVRTVCRVYLKLLEMGVSGEIYNVCSGQTYSLSAVLSALTTLTGHRVDVSVNPDFVRAQEVGRLSGDPTKLDACIGQSFNMTLEDTLEWMLGAGH